jgi:replicative DNA helicase
VSAALERRVLAGLLFAAEVDEIEGVSETIRTLRPEMFERRSHRAIFEAIAAVADGGSRPCLVVVTRELDRRGTLKGIQGQVAGPDGDFTVAEGALFVTGLTNETFTGALLPHHVDTLRAIAARRETARLADALAAATRNERPLPEIRAIIKQLQQIEVPA